MSKQVFEQNLQGERELVDSKVLWETIKRKDRIGCISDLDVRATTVTGTHENIPLTF